MSESDEKTISQLYTQLLRKHLHPKVWGNWLTESGVEVGAMGYMDPDTGAFKRTGHIRTIIKDFEKNRERYVEDIASSKSFEIKSTGVKITDGQGSATVSGPEAEADADADADADDDGSGLDWHFTWHFEKKETISSNGSMVGEHHLKDSSNLLQALVDDHYDEMRAVAGKEWVDQDTKTVVEGFGIITDAYTAQSGVNFRSTSDNAKVSMSGKEDLLQKFLGLSGNVGGGGSFTKVSKNTDVVKVDWLNPGEKLTEKTLRNLYYKFASFDDKTVLMDWVENQGDHLLVLRNHSTYNGSYYVEYTLQGKAQNPRQDNFYLSKDSRIQLPAHAEGIHITITLGGRTFGPYTLHSATFGSNDTYKIYCQGTPGISDPTVHRGKRPSGWFGSDFYPNPEETVTVETLENNDEG